MKSNKPLDHSTFFAKPDTLEHFEMNLIVGSELQLRVSKHLSGVVGTEKFGLCSKFCTFYWRLLKVTSLPSTLKIGENKVSKRLSYGYFLDFGKVKGEK